MPTNTNPKTKPAPEGGVKAFAEAFFGLALLFATIKTDTANGFHRNGVDSSSGFCGRNARGAPGLMYAASMMHVSAADTCIVALDEDEEEKKRKKGKRTLSPQSMALPCLPGTLTPPPSPPAPSSSSDATVDTLDHSIESDEHLMMMEPFTGRRTEATVSGLTMSMLDVDTIAHVMSFANARDMTHARGACKHFAQAASHYMQYHHDKAAMFFRFPDADALCVRPAYAPSMNVERKHWECTACAATNAVGAKTCAKCDTVAAGSALVEATASQRVFMGQLRKEQTPEFIDWMTRMLCNGVNILHIENHTSKDGRGKGCAWVYAEDSVNDVAELLRLNKRCYADVDEDGLEGVFVCRDEDADKTALFNFAQHRSTVPSRPRRILPRNPVVCELPQKSIPPFHTSEAPVGPLHNATGPHHHRPHHEGAYHPHHHSAHGYGHRVGYPHNDGGYASAECDHGHWSHGRQAPPPPPNTQTHYDCSAAPHTDGPHCHQPRPFPVHHRAHPHPPQQAPPGQGPLQTYVSQSRAAVAAQAQAHPCTHCPAHRGGWYPHPAHRAPTQYPYPRHHHHHQQQQPQQQQQQYPPTSYPTQYDARSAAAQHGPHRPDHQPVTTHNPYGYPAHNVSHGQHGF